MQPPRAGLALLDLVANPSDRPELAVALFAQSATSNSQTEAGLAAVLDLSSPRWMAEINASSPVSSVCWSVKGKQVAMGLQSGEIAQFIPEGEQKDVISRPSELVGSYALSDLRWIENHVFVATYTSNAPQDSDSSDSSQDDQVFVILRDNATKAITFVRFPLDPATAFGGDESLRSRRFYGWLKGWDELKHLLFVANVPSTDVGVIGCKTSFPEAGGWCNLELDETSRPALPFSSLDKSSDTSPVAIELDLTSTDRVDDPRAAARGEDGKEKFPPMPILNVYTNDGVLLAYHVIHVDGIAYPSLQRIEGGNEQGSSTAASSVQQPALTTTPSPFAAPSGSTPAFGAATFGAPSAFGAKTSPAAAFGTATAFGTAAPAFGSAFAPSSPSPAAPSTSFGFGGFASKSTAPAFGAPAASSASTTVPFGAKAADTSHSIFGNAAPAKASPAPAFGQASAFGQGCSSVFGQGSAFGKSPFGQTPAFGQQSTSEAKEKPATGFAFGGATGGDTKGASAADTTRPATAFSFGQTSTSGGFAGLGSASTGGFGGLAKGSVEASSSIFQSGKAEKDKSQPAPVFGGNAPTGSELKTIRSAAEIRAQEEEAAAAKRDQSQSGGFSFSNLNSMLDKEEEDKEEEKDVEIAGQSEPSSGEHSPGAGQQSEEKVLATEGSIDEEIGSAKPAAQPAKPDTSADAVSQVKKEKSQAEMPLETPESPIKERRSPSPISALSLPPAAQPSEPATSKPKRKSGGDDSDTSESAAEVPAEPRRIISARSPSLSPNNSMKNFSAFPMPSKSIEAKRSTSPAAATSWTPSTAGPSARSESLPPGPQSGASAAAAQGSTQKHLAPTSDPFQNVVNPSPSENILPGSENSTKAAEQRLSLPPSAPQTLPSDPPRGARAPSSQKAPFSFGKSPQPTTGPGQSPFGHSSPIVSEAVPAEPFKFKPFAPPPQASMTRKADPSMTPLEAPKFAVPDKPNAVQTSVPSGSLSQRPPSATPPEADPSSNRLVPREPLRLSPDAKVPDSAVAQEKGLQRQFAAVYLLLEEELKKVSSECSHASLEVWLTRHMLPAARQSGTMSGGA